MDRLSVPTSFSIPRKTVLQRSLGILCGFARCVASQKFAGRFLAIGGGPGHVSSVLIAASVLRELDGINLIKT